MWDSGWGNQKRKAQGFHGVFRYEMNSNDFEVPLETGLRRKLEDVGLKLEPQARNILLDMS